MDLLGIGTAVSGLAQSGASIANTVMTNKANRQLAEYAYSKDLEMWNRGNEYNSPIQQMERLKAAGLNPNMVYGSGSAVGNTTGQLPKYNAPTLKYDFTPPDLMNMLSVYQDVKVKQANTENVIEETKSKKLMNQITGSTLIEQIDKIKADSDNTIVKNNLENLKFHVENSIWGENSTPVRQSGQYKLKSAEIIKSQADSRKAVIEADLKQMQKSIFEKFGVNNAGVIMQLLLGGLKLAF